MRGNVQFGFYLGSCLGGLLWLAACVNSESDYALTCPTGFVKVPRLSGYTDEHFCVAKYEMKLIFGEASSQAMGVPAMGMSRDDALSWCENMGHGYDLITNSEWQSLVRNVEGVAVNWQGGEVGGSGEGVNRGHSDNSPAMALAATSDDSLGCQGTGESCGGRVWHNQRRTHLLSNGEVVWDVGGNLSEWVKDDSNGSVGSDGDAHLVSISTTSHTVRYLLDNGASSISGVAKKQFGPKGDYLVANFGQFAGLGYAKLNSRRGAIVRGGHWYSGEQAGVFAVDLSVGAASRLMLTGFRCVYRAE